LVEVALVINEITACVTTFNSRDVIGPLVSQINFAASRADLSCEVLVVDNVSTDDTVDAAKRLPCVKVIVNLAQANVSASRNLAMRHASHRYVWFFDDDSLVDSDAFVRAKTIIENKTPDVVMPLVINENGIPHNCRKEFGKHVDSCLPAEWVIRDCSSSFIVNVDAVREKTLWFDETMPFMWEDVEYFFRLKREKLQFYYTCDLSVGHRVKQINGRMGHRFYLQTKNALILWRRLNGAERRAFRIYLPGGSMAAFMLFSFLAACMNYNFWADFYNPGIQTTGDRFRSLLRRDRLGLDRSFLHCMYYFGSGCIAGLIYR
jgi:glycosyltransferase involved in cell wall biosynthesis